VPHFTRVRSIHDITPGSMLVINYDGAVSDDNTGFGAPSGHVAFIRKVKGEYTGTPPAAKLPGMTQYIAEVIDDTRSPHGTPGPQSYQDFPDSRIYNDVQKGNGAGYGHMIIYADRRTGRIKGYRWSPTDPHPHVGDHPMLVAAIR
jgi:hypothetical protein